MDINTQDLDCAEVTIIDPNSVSVIETLDEQAARLESNLISYISDNTCLTSAQLLELIQSLNFDTAKKFLQVDFELPEREREQKLEEQFLFLRLGMFNMYIFQNTTINITTKDNRAIAFSPYNRYADGADSVMFPDAVVTGIGITLKDGSIYQLDLEDLDASLAELTVYLNDITNNELELQAESYEEAGITEYVIDRPIDSDYIIPIFGMTRDGAKRFIYISAPGYAVTRFKQF